MKVLLVSLLGIVSSSHGARIGFARVAAPSDLAKDTMRSLFEEDMQA
jgi:hypothetical protein